MVAPPSSPSLLGLVRHLSEVERGWFAAFAGADASTIYYTDEEPDADFDGVRDADVLADFAGFRAEVDSARRLVRERSLDDTEVIHGGPSSACAGSWLT